MEPANDLLFNKLAKYMYRDALALQENEAAKVTKFQENSRLTGALICIDARLDAEERFYEIPQATNLLYETPPRSLYSPDIDKLLEDMLREDGAIMVEDGEIIANSVHYDGLMRELKKERSIYTISDIESIYLGNTHAKTGTRTRTGLAVALYSKNPDCRVLVMSKTAYTDVGTGRLFEIGPDGTVREYFLEYSGEVEESGRKKVIGVQNDYRYDDALKKVVTSGSNITEPIGKDKLEL